MPTMTFRHIAALALFIAATLAVAAIGGAVTAGSVDGWYVGIVKPSFNPPAGVFGPVWTVLYLMMAVAAWRVWCREKHAGRPAALTLFAVQLGLNLGWSLLFFGLHAPGLALLEIVVLWLAIAATMRAFLRIDAVAGYLLAPYLAWVAFAAVLNLRIWQLN